MDIVSLAWTVLMVIFTRSMGKEWTLGILLID